MNPTHMTWSIWYWPVFLGGILLAFLPAEIYGLATGGQNSLSNWVWQHLKIATNESIGNWSALDYLIFGLWVVLITWLTAHFFFRRFT
jgi:hypothetical protein